METLEERRTQARLNMAYKIINGLVILEPKSLPKFTSKRMQRGCNFAKVGIENQLLEPQARLNLTEKTFFYSIPKLWNQMVTPEQASAPSVDAFKQHFKRKTN